MKKQGKKNKKDKKNKKTDDESLDNSREEYSDDQIINKPEKDKQDKLEKMEKPDKSRKENNNKGENKDKYSNIAANEIEEKVVNESKSNFIIIHLNFD
jgi:hypothetical protein